MQDSPVDEEELAQEEGQERVEQRQELQPILSATQTQVKRREDTTTGRQKDCTREAHETGQRRG